MTGAGTGERRWPTGHPCTGQPATLPGWVDEHARRHGDRVALVEGDGTWTYRELADAVAQRADELRSPRRRLVALISEPTGRFVVDYLATMAAGHAALVGQSVDADLRRRFEPDLLLGPGGVEQHRGEHRWPPPHPDLALLLSTSGSTGSPKLVRLSHRNLAANAESIASYLGLTEVDATITSLPLSYCYGLSLVHSHLVAGAATVLTGATLVDPEFWHLLGRHRVTTLAGVPYSFELFDRMGLAGLDLPALRRITCAGGRLDADRVVHWYDVGAARGWDLFVMYGQTEATARMAYLPPHLARSFPTAVGRPVPGGRITLRNREAGDEPGTGEIVYHGPNVMMGYAEVRADLARPAELTELATGDLGRIIPGTDLLEIVGRARRFVKPLGVRVDLDRLEARLAELGLATACAGDDQRITIAVETGGTGGAVIERRGRDGFAALTGLPRDCARVVACPELPRTSCGKIDHAAVTALGAVTATPSGDTGQAGPGAGRGPSDLRAAIGAMLGVAEVDPGATFVDLGGDSLSYVDVSAFLETALAEVPRNWHLMAMEELESLPRADDAGRRRGSARLTGLAAIDTTALLRAIGICAVVGTHMGVMRAQGGAHLMLAVAGFNFARFHLARPGPWGVLGGGARTAAHAGVPAALWIGANLVVTGRYSLGAALLVNDYTGGAARTGGRWEYWFFEAFVKIVLVSSVLVSVPLIRRWERRRPYGFALVVVAALLPLRYGWLRLGDDYNYLFRAHTVAWFFALGWLVMRSERRWQRVATAGVVAAMVPGFFHNPQREWFIIAGLVLLTGLDRLRLPRPAVTGINLVAGSSMWIFLFHWQLWPAFERVLPPTAAYGLTVIAGCLAPAAMTQIRQGLRGVISGHRPERRRGQLQADRPQTAGANRAAAATRR